MSELLGQLLVCPECAGELALTEGDRTDGKLRCAGGHAYPLIGGVPRMFVGPLPPELVSYHSDYFRRFRAEERARAGEDAHAAVKARTSQAFGFEWMQFPDYAADNYEKMVGPAMAHDVAGERVLEIGCGAGRHAVRTALRGAEVIALDYSMAVEPAAEKARQSGHVHVVQGDVYHLPFRTGAFDCAYSLGVLHHLPAPEDGFRRMAERVRPGGSAFVWLYKRTLRKVLFEPFRRPLTHLSPSSLRRVAYLAAVVDYGVFCNAYRLVARSKWLEPCARLFPSRTREYSTYDFAVSYTDWYDRLSAPIVRVYTEADVQGWFQRAGFEAIVVSSQADFGVRGFGRIAVGEAS